MLPNVRFPKGSAMFFSECVVLPSRQSMRPHAADFSFEHLVGNPSRLFHLFLLCAIEMSSANKEVGPGGAQSRPKAPLGLPTNVPTKPHVLPGARFSGLGEPPFLNNTIMVWRHLPSSHGRREDRKRSRNGHGH